MRNVRFAVMSIVAVGILGLSACSDKAKYAESFAEPNVASGQQLYTTNCLACHGDKGQGDGPVAKSLAEAPANIHKKLTSRYASRGELIHSVLHGMDEGEAIMPLFGASLSTDDVNDIFGYIEQANLAR